MTRRSDGPWIPPGHRNAPSRRRSIIETSPVDPSPGRHHRTLPAGRLGRARRAERAAHVASRPIPAARRDNPSSARHDAAPGHRLHPYGRRSSHTHESRVPPRTASPKDRRCLDRKGNVMVAEQPSSHSLRVALALLPLDYEKESLNECLYDMPSILPESAELLVLPECCLGPREHAAQLPRDSAILARELGVPTCAGASFSDGSIGGTIASPDGETTSHVCFKHTEAQRLAFHFPDWLPSWRQSYLRPFRIGGTSVGLTLCHDQTLSLLQRYLALRGVDVLVNPSSGEIQPSHLKKWSTWLRARAIENGVPVVSTMYGWEDGPGRKGYAFAFDPFGDPIPLAFTPTYEDVEPFTARTPRETRVTLDGAYVATMPRRLDRPALPDDPGPAQPIRLRVSLRGRSSGASHLETRVDPRGETVVHDLAGAQIVLVPIPGSEILRPEAVARRIMDADAVTSSAEPSFFVLVSAWRSPCPRESRERVETLAKARAMEHACAVALIGCMEEGTRVYHATRNRIPTEPKSTSGEIPLDSDWQRQQRGGPKWFFSRRGRNDFSALRPHYRELLTACEEAAR